METKAFEIRDDGTFIPVIATRMLPSLSKFTGERERYLLRRSGYNFEHPLVMLCRMDANGGKNMASYDPHEWGWPRTYPQAHEYIQEHWDKLMSGDVIDVQFILGETKTPKVSEAVQG